ncbi:NUDIX domain-containing protein [Actinomycetospora straminea]|uniref:NUDIX domain-containing protein n=1 Tax=Actinomycetospora straminea TaxID=663607 RepID=A0ABP9ETE6_9PSEU|nr:NUDIX domain-containing protein [Actinomycetospora straminea]MDD7933970.1 NUDIX domain-containing protein [Actinomycetospora straminea]
MEVVARAVIVRDGAVLLVRDVGASYWYFPGGHVEDGETAAQALVRELREELDVGVTLREHLATVPNPFVGDGVEHDEVDHVFAVTIDADDPVSAEPGLVAGWHRLADLDAVDVLPRVLVELVRSL